MVRLASWLLIATVVFAVGLDTVTTLSWRLAFLGALLLTVGAGLYASAIVRARRRGTGDERVLVVMVVTALLVGGFFGVRLLARERGRSSSGEVPDPDLGWMPAPGPGLIGRRFQQIDHTREHVIGLGDSVIYGTGVEAHETVTTYLEPLVPPYQVLNVSMPGYSIDQYYLYLLRELPRLRPKLVFVGIFIGNDFQVTGMEVGWEVPKPLFRMRDGKLERVNPGSLERGCVRHLSQSMLFKPFFRDKELGRTLTDFFCQPVRLGLIETEKTIAGLLRAIEDVSQKHGAKVLFLLLPVRHDLKRIDEDASRYTSRTPHLRRILREGGHAYYDFYPDIMRTGEEEKMFLDPGHYTPRGHKLLAEKLAAIFRERRLLPLPPAPGAGR